MLTVTLCGSGMWRVHTTHATQPLPVPAHTRFGIPASTATDIVTPHGVLRREQAEERLDLYGNDVSNAVATYTYDHAGTVYEEHSPQTEVPRLKPPIS